MSLILIAVVAVYLSGMMFSLGAGIIDEMSFTNPNYGFIIGLSVGWPIVVLYAVGNHVFN